MLIFGTYLDPSTVGATAGCFSTLAKDPNYPSYNYKGSTELVFDYTVSSTATQYMQCTVWDGTSQSGVSFTVQ